MVFIDADESSTRVSVAPDGRVYPIPADAERQALVEGIIHQAQAARSCGRKIVVVQGLGFVGTAVAAVVAGACDARKAPLYHVIGIDLPTPQAYWKVSAVCEGRSP